MSAYLLVVGGEQVAWELHASADVEFYETADGLDAMDVLTHVIQSVDASEARLLVADDGPAADGLAAKLAGTLGWVAMITATQPGDSNIIAISPDATPATIAAALDIRFVSAAPVGPETPAPVVDPTPEPVDEPPVAPAPQPRPAEPERSQIPSADPPFDVEPAAPSRAPWLPGPAAPSPTAVPAGPEPNVPEPAPAPAAVPVPATAPAAESPSSQLLVPPQILAPAEHPAPVADPLPGTTVDAPWQPPQHPPAAEPAAPDGPGSPSPQMPWQPAPEQAPAPETPGPTPGPDAATSAGSRLDSDWKGVSTLDDPSYAAAPWAAQTGRSPHDRNGLVIIVASGKGGVGKSTMSMWVTEALTQLGHGAVLVDANVGQSDISKMSQVWAEAPGLATLIGRQRLSAAEVLDACMPVPGLGPVLAAPRESVLLDFDAALEALEQAIRALAAERPYVIVDGPVGTALEPIYTRVLLRLGDKMLMVMNAHEPTLHDCHNWLKSISKPVEEGGSDWDTSRTVAVVNKFSREDGLSQADIASGFEGLAMCSPVPAVEATVRMNRGRWRCPPEAATAVMEVVQAITGLVVDGPTPQERRSLLSRLLRRD